jgi:glycosyltransferase involved in cell wall biosynthesis
VTPPQRIRIAFMNHTAQLGGGEIALLELIRNLDVTRIEPIVVLFADGPLASLLREEAEVHILPLSTTVLKASKDRLGIASLLRGGPVLAGLSFLFRLRRLLRAIDPHIAYTNSLKADVLGGIAGRLASLPVIWHVRDRIAPDYLPRRIVYIFRKLARVLPRFIIANSASTLSSLHLDPASTGTAASNRAKVIHDGVDATKYEPAHTHAAKDMITVGLIGRISPWKGQDIFLKAIHLIHRTYPCVQFEMIGAATFGETEFEQYLHNLQRETDLVHVAHFTGFESDIPKRLEQLDIVVHASTIPEPFGQVIIEGMAAGLPVIATNGGGVPEIIVDGITGILIPMKDPRALADAMASLLADADLRIRMGAAGRRHILRHFTIRRTAEEVEQVSQRILLNY